MDTPARSEEAQDLADPERFRAFYAALLPHVYGYFLSRCGGQAAIAEDLTQETFLAAVGQIRRGATVQTPRPWLFGIARHKLLDHLRQQKRQGWSVVPWDAEAMEDEDTLFSLAQSEPARERAIAALDAVPVSQREALILHYLDGHSVPEVARQLARSVHATESLLARGRVSFRTRFQEQEQEAGDVR